MASLGACLCSRWTWLTLGMFVLKVDIVSFGACLCSRIIWLAYGHVWAQCGHG